MVGMDLEDGFTVVYGLGRDFYIVGDSGGEQVHGG